MKPSWLFVLIALLVLPACATAAVPTPVATGPEMTKAEAIGLIRQYLQSKTYLATEVPRRGVRIPRDAPPNIPVAKSCEYLSQATFNATYQNQSWTVWAEIGNSRVSWSLHERTGAIVASQPNC